MTDQEKKEVEIKIFKHLDAECEQNSTPLPNKMFDMPLKCELFGIMSRIICDAFCNMRESGGNSNWEMDAMPLIESKVSSKRWMTLKRLKKVLDELQENDLVDYFNEENGKLQVKINASMLFDGCLEKDGS